MEPGVNEPYAPNGVLNGWPKSLSQMEPGVNEPYAPNGVLNGWPKSLAQMQEWDGKKTWEGPIPPNGF